MAGLMDFEAQLMAKKKQEGGGEIQVLATNAGLSAARGDFVEPEEFKMAPPDEKP